MRFLRRFLLVAAAAVACAVLWLCAVWPPPSWWRSHWPARTAFQSMRARQYRSASKAPPFAYRPIPLDSISEWLGKAAVVGEDDAFYQHHGIDWRSVREALGYRRGAFAWGNAHDRAELQRALGRASDRRDRMRGASTITQQLAKNLYLSPSRNPLRKLKEAVTAYRLEWALSKTRILELYLNVVELGPNLWGVEAASERYFGRPAARLSMDQAALLVATLPHPLTSNPAFRPGRTAWRQQLILRRLRGEPVVVPPEEAETAAPSALPADSTDTPPARDTVPVPSKDSAAAPAPKPDTAAAKPPHGPSRP
ncbi:MAG: transglycosylase domain-containing protein [Gemmatimonadales bacterium]